jgi:hypothetical protein
MNWYYKYAIPSLVFCKVLSNEGTILVTFEGFLVGVHTVSGPIRQKSHNDLWFSLVYLAIAYHMGFAYISFADV